MKIFLKKFVLIFVFFIFSLKIYAFSKKDILSPREGTWGNLQALVLNYDDSVELYYSLSGSDPLVSGFAYDGPVLIDETDNVVLKITALDKDGKRSDFTINYSVKNFTYNANSTGYNFIQSIKENPIKRFYSGTEFYLPNEFLYSTDNNLMPYLKAQNLNIDSQNLIERYVPISISDKNDAMFHFVLHIVPQENIQNNSLPLISRTVPFEIRDWEYFKFTGKNLIYQIDDDFWGLDLNEKKLDRSVKHTIRWQSIAYEEGNPVQEIILPPKPNVKIQKNENSSINISIPEDNKFYFAPDNSIQDYKIPQNFFSSITVDTFSGDDFTKDLSFSVYYENIFQGKVSASVSIDKKPPVAPKIESSSASSYTRKEVLIEIKSPENQKIFFAQSLPYENDNASENEAEKIFKNLTVQNYSEYKGQNIKLTSISNKVSFYKICAYCQDENGNKSDVSEYCVIVDEFNYYLNPNSKDLEIQDGTYSHPFVNFEQALSVINQNEYTKLNVTGNIKLNESEYKISSDCLIHGNNAKFIFSPETVLLIDSDTKNLNVSFENLVLEKNSQNSDSNKMLEVKNSDLSVLNCELIGIFDSNGILVDIKNGELKLQNSGFTVNALSYACALNSDLTKINCENARITSSAPTAVCFSIKASNSKISTSNFTVIANLGRCLEIVEATVALENNRFVVNSSSGIKNISPVWKDSSSNYSVYENNIVEAF